MRQVYILKLRDLMKVLWRKKVCALKKVPLLYRYYPIPLKDNESFSAGSVILLGDTDRFDSVTECMGFRVIFLKNDVKCFCRSCNSL